MKKKIFRFDNSIVLFVLFAFYVSKKKASNLERWVKDLIKK